MQDLVVRLGVSSATIRRDLAELAHAGVVKRVHGGAAPLPRLEIDQPYEKAADDAAAEKQRIARAAAASCTTATPSCSTSARPRARWPAS